MSSQELVLLKGWGEGGTVLGKVLMLFQDNFWVKKYFIPAERAS